MNIKRSIPQNPANTFRQPAPAAAQEKPEVISESDLMAEQKKEDLYSGLAFVASGAVAGAVGGAWGNNTLGRTLATTVTTAAADTATLVAIDKVTNPFIHFGHIMGPAIGAGTGIAGGLLGSAITSLTGLNPVASGAIAGGVTHAAFFAGGAALS